MANRSSITSGFAALSPPWVLTTLDGYFNAINSSLNDSSLGYVNTGTDTGSANNYQIPTLAFGTFSGYNQGGTVVLIPAHTNTGASTLTVGILGSAPIVDRNGAALTAGALVAGQAAYLVYSGTSFYQVNSPILPPGFGISLWSITSTSITNQVLLTTTGWSSVATAGTQGVTIAGSTITLHSAALLFAAFSLSTTFNMSGYVVISGLSGNFATASGLISGSTGVGGFQAGGSAATMGFASSTAAVGLYYTGSAGSSNFSATLAALSLPF